MFIISDRNRCGFGGFEMLPSWLIIPAQSGLQTEPSLQTRFQSSIHRTQVERGNDENSVEKLNQNIARGTTDPEIDSETWTKLGNNMAPLALIANLANRWRHLTFSHLITFSH